MEGNPLNLPSGKEGVAVDTVLSKDISGGKNNHTYNGHNACDRDLHKTSVYFCE